MEAHELIAKIKESGNLPLKIWIDGEIYDFCLDQTLTDRIDIHIITESGEEFNVDPKAKALIKKENKNDSGA